MRGETRYRVARTSRKPLCERDRAPAIRGAARKVGECALSHDAPDPAAARRMCESHAETGGLDMSEREDTARLISALLDEQIEEDERVRLELLIETDAAARRLYFQMIDQEVELSCLVVPAGDARVMPVEFKRTAPGER